jgi:molecular chaperone GrpE
VKIPITEGNAAEAAPIDMQAGDTVETPLRELEDADEPSEAEDTGDEAEAVEAIVEVADEPDPLREAEARYLQLAADFENFRRQASRREKETRERANISLVEDLLPVLDNFERALDAARLTDDVESLRMGVLFIAQQLREVLRNHGVEPIETQGHHFDPKHHEALEEVTDTDHPEGTIVHEAQRGYRYRGKVLRPSMVRVAGRKE